MHVARLRRKLADYYRTDGASAPIILDLPKRGFKVVFEDRAASAPAAEQALPPVLGAVPGRAVRTRAIAALIGFAAIAAGTVYLVTERPRTSLGESRAPITHTPGLYGKGRHSISFGQTGINCDGGRAGRDIPGAGAHAGLEDASGLNRRAL